MRRFRQLTRMNEPSFTLKARQTPTVLLCDARRHRAHLRPRPFTGIASRESLCAFPLQFVRQLFHRQGFDNALGRCG